MYVRVRSKWPVILAPACEPAHTTYICIHGTMWEILAVILSSGLVCLSPGSESTNKASLPSLPHPPPANERPPSVPNGPAADSSSTSHCSNHQHSSVLGLTGRPPPVWFAWFAGETGETG